MTKDNITDTFDYGQLDAGIRETVRFLRERGFNTTDSGDGTKAESMECAVGFPMVVIRVENPEALTGEARRLHRVLSMGKDVVFGPGPEDPRIEASYNPADGVALIVLTNVNDELLKLPEE